MNIKCLLFIIYHIVFSDKMLVWLARPVRHSDHHPVAPPGPGHLPSEPPGHRQGCQGIWEGSHLQTRSSSLRRGPGTWHLLRATMRRQLQQGEDGYHDHSKTYYTRWICGLSPLMCHPKRFSPGTLWPSMLTQSCITRSVETNLVQL